MVDFMRVYTSAKRNNFPLDVKTHSEVPLVGKKKKAKLDNTPLLQPK